MTRLPRNKSSGENISLKLLLCRPTEKACGKYQSGEISFHYFVRIMKRISRICQQRYGLSFSIRDIDYLNNQYRFSKKDYRILVCELVHLNKEHLLLKILQKCLLGVDEGDAIVGDFEEKFKKIYPVNVFWANWNLLQTMWSIVIATRALWLPNALNAIAAHLLPHAIIVVLLRLIRLFIQ